MATRWLTMFALTWSTLKIHAHEKNFAPDIEPQILYQEIAWSEERPAYEIFYAAISGYQSLQRSLVLFKKPVITIIDFSRPSNVKRLWVIDLELREVLLTTLVAHGRNSGELVAT
jgi:hypothetical protein